MKILKFYKDNCGPCDEIETVLTKICKEYSISIEYIDNTILCKLAKQMNVLANPTIVLMDNDKELKRHSGVITEQKMIQFVTDI